LYNIYAILLVSAFGIYGLDSHYCILQPFVLCKMIEESCFCYILDVVIGSKMIEARNAKGMVPSFCCCTKSLISRILLSCRELCRLDLLWFIHLYILPSGWNPSPINPCNLIWIKRAHHHIPRTHWRIVSLSKLKRKVTTKFLHPHYTYLVSREKSTRLCITRQGKQLKNAQGAPNYSSPNQPSITLCIDLHT
jgi:hypothetical protein